MSPYMTEDSLVIALALVFVVVVSILNKSCDK